MTIRYTVTISDRSALRQGFRVSCFGLPDDNWNATSRNVAESFHRTRAAALKRAKELAAAWGADLLDCGR